MLIALIGIGGVLLGGLLNAAGGYVLAQRVERRELRTAARLLLPELLQNRENLATAFRGGSWDAARFETTRWAQYELTVISALRDEWAGLTKVYTAFNLLNVDREIRREEGRKSILEDGDDFDYFELTLEATDRAVGILRRWAGLDPDESLRIQEYFCV